MGAFADNALLAPWQRALSPGPRPTNGPVPQSDPTVPRSLRARTSTRSSTGREVLATTVTAVRTGAGPHGGRPFLTRSSLPRCPSRLRLGAARGHGRLGREATSGSLRGGPWSRDREPRCAGASAVPRPAPRRQQRLLVGLGPKSTPCPIERRIPRSDQCDLVDGRATAPEVLAIALIAPRASAGPSPGRPCLDSPSPSGSAAPFRSLQAWCTCSSAPAACTRLPSLIVTQSIAR